MKVLTTTILLSFSSCLPIFGWATKHTIPPLNKVSFQLSAQQWAVTQKAKVTVSINATLDNAALGQIQTQIMANLKKIATETDWHITRFQRSKNDSGLEQVAVLAQARVSQNQLANLRSAAKKVSKPGETYSIADINFSPSLAELQKVKTQLRQKIYGQAKAELATLNQQYPQEKFFLHKIQFSGPIAQPQPRLAPMVLTAVTSADKSVPMKVNDKVILNAKVTLASAYPFK